MKLIRLREYTLTLCFLWLVFWGVFAVASSAAQRANLERIEQRLDGLERKSQDAAIQSEGRLTKLETQIGIMQVQITGLIDANNRLLYGVVGSVGLFVFQNLVSLITAKKMRSRDTKE